MDCRGVLVAVEEKERITINKIEEWGFDEPSHRPRQPVPPKNLIKKNEVQYTQNKNQVFRDFQAKNSPYM